MAGGLPCKTVKPRRVGKAQGCVGFAPQLHGTQKGHTMLNQTEPSPAIDDDGFIML